MSRRVQVEIHIRETGDARILRSYSADFIPLDGQESIEQAFKFSFVKMIEQLEEIERNKPVHRID